MHYYIVPKQRRCENPYSLWRHNSKRTKSKVFAAVQCLSTYTLPLAALINWLFSNLIDDEDADQVDGGSSGRDEEAGIALDHFLV